MMKTTKIIGYGFAIILAVAGFSVFKENLTTIVNGLILLLGGIILASTVAWRELVNKKADEKDALAIAGGGVALIMAIVGLMLMVGYDLPEFFDYITSFGTIIVAIFVAITVAKS